VIADIKARYELDAAWVKVEKMLATKKRGDDVTHAEIARAAAPLTTPRRLDGRVRTYIGKHFGDAIAIVGQGWRIPTDAESVDVCEPARRRRARKQARKALRAVTLADPTKLTPEQQRRRDVTMRHHAGQLQTADVLQHEIKQILGAPPARPRLNPVK